MIYPKPYSIYLRGHKYHEGPMHHLIGWEQSAAKLQHLEKLADILLVVVYYNIL